MHACVRQSLHSGEKKIGVMSLQVRYNNKNPLEAFEETKQKYSLSLMNN